MATIQDLQRAYADELEIFDEEEEDRFEKIKMYTIFNGTKLGYLLIFVQSQGKREGCTKKEADSRRYG